jgi:FKBP-type peptidyl-prolyl cis-trans isomerase
VGLGSFSPAQTQCPRIPLRDAWDIKLPPNMKLTSPTTLLVSALMCVSAMGQDPKPATESSQATDTEKAGAANLSQKNKAEGEAFLAKNAKADGITVLPDGLQYRVIQPGSGKFPTTNDLVFIKYRGRRIDGTEFGHHNRFLTRMDGGIKGWQEALQRMRVGSKAEIFVPPTLAFGDEGEPYFHIEPGSTLIYEIELTSIAPLNPEFNTRGLGHAADEDPQPANANK